MGGRKFSPQATEGAGATGRGRGGETKYLRYIKLNILLLWLKYSGSTRPEARGTNENLWFGDP